MLFHTIASMAIRRTDRTIIGTLWSRKSASGEAWWVIVFGAPEKIFLFESEPEICVVVINRCSAVRFVWGTIRIEHLSHHKKSISTTWIRKERNRLQQTIRIATGCLLGAAAIKRPHRTIFQRSAEVTLDTRFGTQALGRLITVEPDVLKFRFRTHVQPRFNNKRVDNRGCPSRLINIGL